MRQGRLTGKRPHGFCKPSCASHHRILCAVRPCAGAGKAAVPGAHRDDTRQAARAGRETAKAAAYGPVAVLVFFGTALVKYFWRCGINRCPCQLAIRTHAINGTASRPSARKHRFAGLKLRLFRVPRSGSFRRLRRAAVPFMVWFLGPWLWAGAFIEQPPLFFH